MAMIIETARVGAAPDALWQEIGQFAGVGRWHPLLARVDGDGPVRTPEDRDGNRQTERLLEESPRQHFYRYRMERTAIPVRDWTRALLRAQEANEPWASAQVRLRVSGQVHALDPDAAFDGRLDDPAHHRPAAPDGDLLRCSDVH